MTTSSQPSFTHTLLPSLCVSEHSEHSIGIYDQNLGSSPSLHTCSLCQQTFSSRPFGFPSTAPAALAAIRSSLPSQSRSQAFCQSCWLRIYTLSLCWTCGEIVSRSEERVSFGWCWWHWGCFCCLLCRVSNHALKRAAFKGILLTLCKLDALEASCLDERQERY